MDNLFLSSITAELRPLVKGRALAKITLSGSEIILDFRLPDYRVLTASLDQFFPALYLGNLETRFDSQSSHPFLLQLKKRIAGAKVIDITKPVFDRLVYLEFEGYDVGGERRRAGLALALMGRSSNAYLTDDNRQVEAKLFDRGPYSEGERIEIECEKESFDYRDLLSGLTSSTTAEEILEHQFGPNSIFSPLIKREFIARSHSAAPVDAFKSLLEDLFEKKPCPLVYSKLPLSKMADSPVDLKSDLLLSHFELLQARSLKKFEFNSLSEAAHQYRVARTKAQDFLGRINSLRKWLAAEIAKLDGLIAAMSKDRARHENPERLKRCGDLLLANLATARVNGSTVTVLDYYDEQQSEIEIEIAEGEPLQQAAAKYFSRYQKARRALTAIEERETSLRKQVEPLKALASRLEQEPTSETVTGITEEIELLRGSKAAKSLRQSAAKKSKDKTDKRPGRWFQSSDGYEIGVGRNDRDNDYLTFRMARSLDTWLHAGDYPGSHVIIRNPNRNEIPQRTLIEAAQLAAFYSQAKSHPKAAVHYTQKKFVSKPPRAKPGLVRLSSFKTLLVEPSNKLETLD